MRRHMSRAAAAAVGLGLLLGVRMVYGGLQTSSPPQPAAAEAVRAPVSPASPSTGRPLTAALPDSPPLRILIPAINVNAPFTDLSMDSARHLQVPPLGNANLAGWYTGSATPGSTGNAIVLGHVDNNRGPAVFYNLGALHKGDTIRIDRQDHHTAVFTIDAIDVYAKDTFPSGTVYGPTTRPELRVITCGGGYSKTAGHYLGNVVVYAHLTGQAPDEG